MAAANGTKIVKKRASIATRLKKCYAPEKFVVKKTSFSFKLYLIFALEVMLWAM